MLRGEILFTDGYLFPLPVNIHISDWETAPRERFQQYSADGFGGSKIESRFL